MVDLPLLQGAGLKALVALTGNRKNYSDWRGCFQLSMWKQTLDRQDAPLIQRLVDQGVLLGLYAIDEPNDWVCGPSSRTSTPPALMRVRSGRGSSAASTRHPAG